MAELPTFSTDCTCSALRMAARRLSQTYDAALAPEALTTAQYALLASLARLGRHRPKVRELADRLGMDRTTLARNLRPLERDGLVALTADPDDGRVRRVTLTAHGESKRRACQPLWHAAQRRFERDFGTDRSHALFGSLLSIADIFAPAAAAPPEPESNRAG